MNFWIKSKKSEMHTPIFYDNSIFEININIILKVMNLQILIK